jgi:hypothetical protein
MSSITRYEWEQNCNDKFTNHCHHPIPGDTILKVNDGILGLSTVILIPGVITAIPVNQPIANVSIDTACLISPTIKVGFSGILTTTAIAATSLTFNFTLFKTCNTTRVRMPVRSFSFSQLIALAFSDSRSLKLEYETCDDNCEDCCQYTLELTSISSTIPGEVAVTLSYSIVGTISVLAVGSGC